MTEELAMLLSENRLSTLLTIFLNTLICAVKCCSNVFCIYSYLHDKQKRLVPFKYSPKKAINWQFVVLFEFDTSVYEELIWIRSIFAE